MTTKQQVTSHTIASVIVVFDGQEYHASLKRERMSGEGFAHWQNTHQKEIAFAKAICFAEHLKKFGDLGQKRPESSNEYFSLAEARMAINADMIDTSQLSFEL